MKKKTSGLLLLIGILMMTFLAGCTGDGTPLSLRVGIPHSAYVQNPESNYYLHWLEEQTGLDIVPVEINTSRCDEYMELLFASDTDMDIVLFGNGFVPGNDCIEKYVASGDIYSTENGNSVYLNMGTSKSTYCGQLLWLNVEWLQALSLGIPKTTEELKEVLTAFRTKDPNQNGKADEIALIGSTESFSLNPVLFLMNAFAYCDPYHSFYYEKDGKEQYLPQTKQFEAGLNYCKELCREGLLDERTFTYSSGQLSELVNHSENLVGAFTSDSIGQVIYQGNPEIMAKYICVLPLQGPEGEQNALLVETKPSVGGIIINHTGKEKECQKLLDCMMTKEASLIARYGEEGADWVYSDGLDVSIYGEEARITTLNYLWNSPQNKNLNGIGPMQVPEEYLTGVTWNGINSDMEYIDARANTNYSEFFPKEFSNRPYEEEMVKKLVEEWMMEIIGE